MNRRQLPWLPLFLWVLWLLLNNSASAGQLIVGGLLAFAIPAATGAMRPLRSQPRRVLTVFSLMARVAVDVVRSNIAVGRIVLGMAGHEVVSGFIRIQLDMRDPHGLAVLSCVLTATPGSVWTDLNADNILTIHVLDVQDEETWTRLIKDRYERPLMEIFE
ncbi:Na+/H+ antiporter subunit E [Pigmentiphaga aceris]|uniref:Na+/H+ antiporter subunit E n=1 Tax=Pigmentiphaga aceris TaxID=1940612 RepID=A0A5C0AWL7_9BURK|nr:Na+/H+ antiporter subunit E [Pigmentiphaga aceris]QEI06799.1 Na+/H+ antiporter subunit E [Pigmentiphaga aceris]